MNFDFEGEGSGDQSGLTHLITSVSGTLRATDPHWQITMDTYASSAGDPNGFYNIPALAPAVDAFFVMDYELNLAGSPGAASPLTSGQFSSATTLAQYTAAVPASKVILGVPFFGIDWPTTNGTMAANAAGGAADIADSQAQGNGPEYWDPVTDTAWTSYRAGGQWHESYYEGENGLYDVSQLASHYGVRGVGIWALGMVNDDAQMIATLDGISPGPPPGTGPQSTTSSAPTMAIPAPSGGGRVVGRRRHRPRRRPAPAPSAGAGSGGGGGTVAGPAASVAGPAQTTTTRRVHHRPVQRCDGGADADPGESGARAGAGRHAHQLRVRRAAYSCLNGASLNVYDNVNGKAVAEAVTPTNCIAQDFRAALSAR